MWAPPRAAVSESSRKTGRGATAWSSRVARRSVPAPWRATAEAVWLAERDRGRWLLQAYLQVAPLAGSFGPARLFADLLANGGPLQGR